MYKIGRQSLDKFMDYYHGFHDSYIININYDISKAKIKVLLDVFWSGTPIERIDGTLDTHPVKMKIVFNGIEQCNIKEITSSDYIEGAYLKYVKLNNGEFICFASDNDNPKFYVVCDSIEYEELG